MKKNIMISSMITIVIFTIVTYLLKKKNQFTKENVKEYLNSYKVNREEKKEIKRDEYIERNYIRVPLRKEE